MSDSGTQAELAVGVGETAENCRCGHDELVHSAASGCVARIPGGECACKEFALPNAYIGYIGHYTGDRRQNWMTPLPFFLGLDAEFGFTMDGASEPGNGLLPRSSSIDQPLSWIGERVFCNPPWSDIRPFVELAALADLAVLLVPARTNSRWFHRALALGASARFFPGRPSFGATGPQKGHNSPVDCLLLVFTSATSGSAATEKTDE